MSAYVTFLAKTPDNKFYTLADLCRSCKMYKVANDTCAPIGAIRKVQSTTIEAFRTQFKSMIHDYEVMIATHETEKSNIISMTGNSVNEKLDAIHDADEAIEELKLEISECEHYLSFCTFLDDIIHGGWDERPALEVYFGIEIPDEITIKNIV